MAVVEAAIPHRFGGCFSLTVSDPPRFAMALADFQDAAVSAAGEPHARGDIVVNARGANGATLR